ncbi:MAG: hypothetical protein ACTJHT_08640 [Sphingobacterium sp.]
MNKLKPIFLLLIATGITFTITSACSDDDNEILPVLNDANSDTEIAEIVVPPGDKIFFDFKTNTSQDSAESMINLSGMYGSSLSNSRSDTYNMGYFDLEDSSIEDLKLADILEATVTATNDFSIDASSAGAPATGPTWIIYDFQNNHAVYPTPNRYIVMYKGPALNNQADELYVLNAESVVAAQGTATYEINVKKFIKE